MIEAQFSWTRQWYPVSPIDYLDSSRPNPIALLGKNLVVWQDKNQNWIAMEDLCPHKLAKLSIGSIDKKKGWSNTYYLATPSDEGAIVFRKWSDKFADRDPS